MARNVGQELPEADLEERRAKLSAFVQESKMWPSDSEIMNTTLQLIANRSEPESTRIQGLKMLQDIVEDTLLANGKSSYHPPPLSHTCSSLNPHPGPSHKQLSELSSDLCQHIYVSSAGLPL